MASTPAAPTDPAPSDSGTPDDTAPPTDTAPPIETAQGNRFFAWLRSLGVPRRSGWLGGVSAGVADRLGIDPLIVRGVVVVVAILGGPALILYAAAWLLLPDTTGRIHLEDVFRGRLESPIAGIGALILLSMLPLTQGFWFVGAEYWGEPYWGQSIGRAIWTLVVLAAVIVFIVWVARRADAPLPPLHVPPLVPTDTEAAPDAATTPPSGPPTAPPAADAPAADFAAWRTQQAQWKTENDAWRRQQASEASRIARERARAASELQRAEYRAYRERSRPSALFSLIIVGSAVITGALTALAVGGGTPENNAIAAGLAVALATIGIGMLVNGLLGKRAGGANFFTVPLIIALLLAAALPQVPQLRLSGDMYLEPQHGESRDLPFVVVAGDVVLDLTDFYDTAGPARDLTALDVIVLSGDVTVTIPYDEYTYVAASAPRGTVSLPDGDLQSGNSGGRFAPEDDEDWENVNRSLDIEIWAGNGDITIIQEDAPATGAGE